MKAESDATVEALCDRVVEAWPAGVARQRAVLVAGMDALLAQAWDEGARRGYALYDTQFAYVERENPYRSTPPVITTGGDDR